jgi:hypothetical protein
MKSPAESPDTPVTKKMLPHRRRGLGRTRKIRLANSSGTVMNVIQSASLLTTYSSAETLAASLSTADDGDTVLVTKRLI